MTLTHLEQHHVVHVGSSAHNAPSSNTISTTKFNAFNFLPKCLFFQFLRIANTYFLALAILEFIPEISPTGTGKSSILAPLLLVLGVSLLREGIEDWKRHKSNKEINGRTCHLVTGEAHDGSYVMQTVSWASLKTGQMVSVKNGESIPADLLLVKSDEATHLCWVETSDLDGESNFKPKNIPDVVAELPYTDLLSLRLECDLPNRRLYDFWGRLYLPNTDIVVGPDQLLLRGSSLRNTQSIVGVVVYAGHESKILMNALAQGRMKRSRLELVTNSVLIVIFCLEGLLCLLSTFFAGFQQASAEDLWFLSLHTQVDASIILLFFTFLINYSNLVPISLYVSLEIVKLVQAIWMKFDLKLNDAERGLPLIVNTTSLNEELGKVDHIFTDKTGTLTQNHLFLRTCWLPSTGQYSWVVDHENPNKMSLVGSEVGTVCGSNPARPGLVEFLIAIAVCNTVTPTRKDQGKREYHGSSVDEVALVDGVASVGCVLTTRLNNRVEVRVFGTTRIFTVCHVLEFTSDRKCMSVIVRTEDNRVLLLCKGADSVVVPKISSLAGDGDEVYNAPTNLVGANGGRNLPPLRRGSSLVLSPLSPSAYGRRTQILPALSSSSTSLDLGPPPVSTLPVAARSPTPPSNAHSDVTSATLCPDDDGGESGSRRGSSGKYDSRRGSGEGGGGGAEGRRDGDNSNSSPAAAAAKKNSGALEPTGSGGSEGDRALRVSGLEGSGGARNLVSGEGGADEHSDGAGAGAGAPTAGGLSGEDEPGLLAPPTNGLAQGVPPGVIPSPQDPKSLKATTSTSSAATGHMDWRDLLDVQSAVVEFAHQGYRTMCYASTELSECDYLDWLKNYYHPASISSKKRNEELANAAALVERNLQLLGVTAIEDKLQEGVPAALRFLHQTGVKVWMLTGDMEDTARTIAQACGLIKDVSAVRAVRGSTADVVLHDIQTIEEEGMRNGFHFALSVAGPALHVAMESCPDLLCDLALRCQSVICCRVSPHQKAVVVKLVKERTKATVLAIGDGANDVNMIQTAHVGVGISGIEGRQAVQSADFGIAQFSFLTHLMCVHGRSAYINNALLVLFSFYKNFTLVLPQFFFLFLCGASGQPFYDQWLYQLFNVVFAGLPILMVASWDRDVERSAAVEYSGLYRTIRAFSVRAFLVWVTQACYHAGVCFSVSLLVFRPGSDIGQDSDLFIQGCTCFFSIVLVVNLKLMMDTNRLWPVLLLCFALSAFSFPLIALLRALFDLLPETFWSVPYVLFADGRVYLSVTVSCVACLLPQASFLYVQRNYFPTPVNIIQERTAMHASNKVTPRAS